MVLVLGIEACSFWWMFMVCKMDDGVVVAQGLCRLQTECETRLL